MKKCLAILFVFLCGTLFADDFKWAFINALSVNDFQVIENILKENSGTMSAAEKNLLKNFSLNYSYGENAIRALDLLEKYNIRPGGFDLYTAINMNQPDIVIQSILNKGVKPNGEILLLTMEKQRFDLAMQFIKAGANVNYSYPLTSSYADGMTPLLYAVKWNNFELVKMLVENGAFVNAKDKNGNTALSIAGSNGNNPIYNFLVEHGAVETVNNIQMPSGSTGISGFMENPLSAFQTGMYRLFGGNMDLRFSGSANSGTVSYTANGRLNNGFYKIEGENLSLIMEGRTFLYKIDSSNSFSGNGEVWIRMGN